MDARERLIEATERVEARWIDAGILIPTGLVPGPKAIFDKEVAREVQAMLDADMDAAEYAGREG